MQGCFQNAMSTAVLLGSEIVKTSPTQNIIEYSRILQNIADIAENSKQDIINLYVELLRDITLNYATLEERRFITNIDYIVNYMLYYQMLNILSNIDYIIKPPIRG